MERQVLRRIGWIGATLGLTSALVGCGNLASDSESNVATGGGASSASGYINSQNGLVDPNGLQDANGHLTTNGLFGVNGLKSSNGFWAVNGLVSSNGFAGINGLTSVNGFAGVNGFTAGNGLTSVNGFNLSNGLTAGNGLTSTNGYMTNEHGRTIVQYLVRCALPSGDSLVKQDDNGVNFTFQGGLGLAPQFKTGGCNRDCAEMLSACMMAHINSTGTHIPLWMVSPDEGSVGWGSSPAFPTREGTFFGQIMVTNAQNNLDGYYCNGPGSDQNVVPGRLGANQSSVPYANAWPTSAGMDGLCESTAPQHVNNSPTNGYDHGRCVPHTYNTSTHAFGCAVGSSNCVIDGDSSCTLNGVAFNHPITVWRGATYQAEAAQGGAWLNNGSVCTPGTSGCAWVAGGWGFIASNCTTPGTNGCAIIVDSANGMGKRVGYLTGGGKGLKFANVTAAGSGTQNLIVYYTNGDNANVTRYLSFVVNSSAPQVRPFGGLNDWKHPRGASISLSGFNSGSNNTIFVTADPNDGAPDLDWIEVVGTSSTIPTSGLCQPSKWTVTSSVNNCSGNNSNLVDGDLGDRWTTGTAQAVGQYVQVDFQGLVNLSSITLNNSQTSGGDYVDTYGVYSSQDGVNFSSTPFVTGSGAANNSTALTFPKESLRAIRIKVLDTSDSGWWSIGELQTTCSL